MNEQNMQWLDTITNESHRRIAINLNVSQSTISRAAQSPEPNPILVRDICRMYGTDPLQALHDAGFLTGQELADYRTISPIERHSTKELLQELLRREHREH